jgi:hypothetical protein
MPATSGHAVTGDGLDQLSPAPAAGGVLLGRDPDHRPVLVSLFRPRPVRFALVGGAWPARPLLMRVLAVGARVVAAPSQPDWVSLGRWATGQDGWVLPPGSPLPAAHPAAPVLVSVDATLPGQTLPLLSPWQAAVSATPRPVASMLSGTDLAVTGRLAPPDAALAVQAYGLDADSARLLTRMYDNMVALIEPGTVRYAWPTPSAAETEILTPGRAQLQQPPAAH